MKSKYIYLYAVLSFLISLSGFRCSDIIIKDVSDSESSENDIKVYKSRIEGGDTVKIENYPYNAFIFNGLNESCTGAIIGIKWILTAGHCKVDGVPSSNIRVYVGSANRFQGSKHTVKNAIRHPQYNVLYKSTKPVYIYNDLMVLELEDKLVYGRNIANIIIGANEDIAKGKEGLITGYGVGIQTTNISTDSLMVLRSAKVDIMTRENCVSWYPRIAVGEFCAGRDGSYICMGDSGGPIVSDTRVGRRLLGVALAFVVGSNGVCKKNPALYSSVPYVQDWILGVMEGSRKETSV